MFCDECGFKIFTKIESDKKIKETKEIKNKSIFRGWLPILVIILIIISVMAFAVILSQKPSPNPLPKGLTADFSYSITGRTVYFTDESTPAESIYTLDWDFGDKTHLVTWPENPNHTYFYPGTYTVKLTVTDNYGKRDSCSKTISVSG
jgi:PKD repeat protein